MPRIKAVADKLKSGAIVAMPANTIYGLFGSARKPETVKKITALKGRADDKPFIVLIASWSQLSSFGLKLTKKEKSSLRQIWPGPISVIFPGSSQSLEYLHHGQGLALRWPKNKFLTTLIKKTGPLVSTSANRSGDPPAATAPAARKIFGEEIDLYLSASRKQKKKPSTLIEFKDDKIKVHRLGPVTIKKLKQKLNYDFI